MVFNEMLIAKIAPVLYKITGRKHFEMLQWLQSNEVKSAEEIMDIQFIKLKNLLKHTYNSVPYYYQLFKKIGMVPEDIQSLEEYKYIPILTKEIIRDNLNELKSQTHPKNDFIYTCTGGSSGEPINFYHSRRFRDATSAGIFRNYIWTGWNFGEKILKIWGNPRDIELLSSWKQKIKLAINRQKIINAFYASNEDFKDWIRIVNKYKPKLIYGYASSISDFSKFIARNEIKIYKPKAVVTSTETLFPERRAIIKKAFKTKVFNHYGSREIWTIASECKYGNMHINSDLCLVEFIKDAKIPSPFYKIIITPLDNFAMPLIRYDIEDYGAPKEGKCLCGLNFPLMEINVGRTLDNFITSQGEIISGYYLYYKMYYIKGIAQYQFYQDNPKGLKLFLVKNERFNQDTLNHLKNLRRDLAREIDPSMKIDIKYVDTIKPSPSGKQRFIISELIK